MEIHKHGRADSTRLKGLLSRLVIALTAIGLPAAAATPPKDLGSRAEVEAYIRSCEVQWANVAVTGNPSPVAACLADDYQGVSSRSELRDRATLLKPFKPEASIISDTLDYLHIRFPSPEVAIAQGGETAVAKDGSRTSLIWTDVWMLRGGRWQIVTSQDSRLPKPYERPH